MFLLTVLNTLHQSEL